MLAALTPLPVPRGLAHSLAAQTRRANLVILGYVSAVATGLLVPVGLYLGDLVGAVFGAVATVLSVVVAQAARRGHERVAAALLAAGGLALVVGNVALGGVYGTGAFFVVMPVMLAAATIRPWAVVATTLGGALALAAISYLGPAEVVLERWEVLASVGAILAVAAGVALVQSLGWVRALHALHGRDVGMRTADARYNLVAEAMSDLVTLVDPVSGEMLYASPSYQRALGFDPSWLDARALLFIVHPDDRTGVRDLMHRAAEHGSARGLMRMRDAAGCFLTFEVASDSLQHEGRKVVALVARDVTAQRGLQDQLAQAQKMELVGRLSGGIAHDFNNLLTVSRSCAEFARDTLAADHPARRELDDLIDATARGAGLTRQLLALARKEAPDPDARCAVEKVLGDLQRLLPRVLGSTIRYEAHTELGLGSVVGQAVQVEQVILNLALNARDAMPSGGALTIRAFREVADDPDGPDRVALEVRDTGTGMAPEVAARLFEPFFTTKPVGVGNGLGLATSRTIVNQLGGDIRVWTEPGKGTAFTVLLRAAGAGQTAERRPPALAVVRTTA